MMGKEVLNKGFHIATIIADDDTTMKKIMKWNYKEMIERGLMKKEDHSLNKDEKNHQ